MFLTEAFISMEVLDFQKNFRLPLRMCYRTCQLPFVWSETKNGFFVDKSVKFKVMSSIVFLMETISIFICMGSAIRNHLGGLNYKFTLILLFLLVAAIQNIFLDINFILNQTVTLQLLNAVCGFLKLNRGKRKFGFLKLIGARG